MFNVIFALIFTSGFIFKYMDFDIEEIYKWIDTYAISRQKRNINRDFSDAVPLAEILKHRLPKLVDLHNYSPKNSVAQKVVNWNTLNKKVLPKIGITLSSSDIDELAKSTPGAIEKLLHEIKNKLDEKDEKEKAVGDIYYVEGLTAQVTGSVMPVKVKNGSKIIDQKIVPSNVYDEMKKSIQEKDETITVLKNRVEHLESLIGIKDERINDLTEQIKKLTCGSSRRLITKIFKSE